MDTDLKQVVDVLREYNANLGAEGNGNPRTETYFSVKRDLLQCQKRPITVSKETYYSVKRDLLHVLGHTHSLPSRARPLSLQRSLKRRIHACHMRRRIRASLSSTLPHVRTHYLSLSRTLSRTHPLGTEWQAKQRRDVGHERDNGR
jgi:hypothetical protein